MAMLRLRDVAIARGGMPLLSAVSFDVTKGDVVLLRGPNGLGKTSLLRSIVGLLPPTAGRIECDTDVAFVSHGNGIKAALSVRENLSLLGALLWRRGCGGRIGGV